jgi:hypothetical protein
MLSGGGRSFQFGHTSPPMMPQQVQTMRRRKDGTGTVSANALTLITASWRQSSHLMDKERTPFARMLASVIGGPQ